jgi:serine O-acetyltransferase
MQTNRKMNSMSTLAYPRNKYVKNPKLANLYLSCKRHKWRIPAKLIGTLIGCDIGCTIPDRFFIPHPNGVVVDTLCQISNDVVLLQQVTLGGLNPYHDSTIRVEDVDPILKEGVYVGPGAKILGHITIGEWSIIGANAVITKDIPPFSIVVGYNKILEKKTKDIKWVSEKVL